MEENGGDLGLWSLPMLTRWNERTAPLEWNHELPLDVDLIVVGGGFSGLTTAMMVTAERPGTRIAIVERSPLGAPGIAFGACEPSHLLNVPAERMGALPDDAAGFLSWLSREVPGVYGEGDFVPRVLYGAYLNELVRERICGRGANVRFVRGEVTRMRRAGGAVEAAVRSGRVVTARAAVLALGLPSGRAPWAGVDGGAPASTLVDDPWFEGAFDVDADADILIIGSGLTAIDVVIALVRRAHRGHITVISRNGRFPLPHSLAGDAPHSFTRTELEGSPGEVFATVRAVVAARQSANLGWAAVIDAVRPHATALWQAWSPRDRRQFLSRLRPLWEIHRHRVPGPVLDEIETLRASGRLSLVRGRLVRVGAAGAVRARATLDVFGASPAQLDVARIYNCTGPARSVRESSDILVQDLLSNGIATSDSEGLGLRADASGRLVNASGRQDPRLVLVGALRRGELWESTAVPELREQARAAAQALVRVLPAMSPPARRGGTMEPSAAQRSES